MILPYYQDLWQNGSSSLSTYSTLLVACGGYLLVFVGSLVRWEGCAATEVEPIDQYALLLLVPLLAGSKPDFLSALGLTDLQVETILATSLGALGYIGLWRAVRCLRPPHNAYVEFTTIAFLYAGLDVAFGVIQLLHREGSAMGALFACLFAAAKLALTITFLYSMIKFIHPKMGPAKMLNVLVGADQVGGE